MWVIPEEYRKIGFFWEVESGKWLVVGLTAMHEVIGWELPVRNGPMKLRYLFTESYNWFVWRRYVHGKDCVHDGIGFVMLFGTPLVYFVYSMRWFNSRGDHRWV